jgi:hypothetical protein
LIRVVSRRQHVLFRQRTHRPVTAPLGPT